MNKNAEKILQDNVLGALATVNQDGSPWVTPLHVFYSEGAVYWFSGENKQHSVNLARDSRGSITVWSPDESQGPQGVYINGRVEILDESGRAVARQIVADLLGAVPAALENSQAYRLAIGPLDEARTAGSCYYFDANMAD